MKDIPAPQLPTDPLPNSRPRDWRNPVRRGRYRLLVIGAGPAGLMAARMAAAQGASVALIEAHQIGGNCINDGCIPSKTLIRSATLYAEMRDAENFGVRPPAEVIVDFPAVMARMRRIRERMSRVDTPLRLAAAGIDLYFGFARFVAADAVEVEGQRLHFDKAMIATGTRALLPEIEGLAEAGYQTNETVFELRARPASLLVIGGGPLGCELAQAFARLGSRTLISHREPLFLPLEERDAAQMVSEALTRDGVEIHLNSEVTRVRIEAGLKRVEMRIQGDLVSTAVDEILTGIGRLPAVQGLDLDAAGVAWDETGGVRVDDFLRTRNPRIYAAGDVCLEHQFTSTAEASARIVVHNALMPAWLSRRRRMSALTAPWCTYTDPQVAHVGMYVKQARERRIPVKTFTIPMHEVDRAIADGEEDGFVKIHVRDGSDHILGATIVSRCAGELINNISLAMEAGIGLRRLARVMHAYPTQGEAIRMAAQACAREHESPLRAWLQGKWLRR